MARSIQNITAYIIKILLALGRQFAVFCRSTLLPLADFFWRSLMDLITLVNTSENRGRLKRWTLVSLMRAERRLEAVLPDSFKHGKPVKTVGLLLLVLILLRLQGGDSSVDSLKEDGELVVISRESPITLYQGSEGPAGPEYDLVKGLAESLDVELVID